MLAILGPALTDGALAVRPLADDAGVPCINYAGNDQARSAYLFHFQIGSLEDEPSLLVDDLVRRRLARVALIQDPSEVGNRMAAFFADAAAAARCDVVTHAVVEHDGTGAAAAVAAARQAGARGAGHPRLLAGRAGGGAGDARAVVARAGAGELGADVRARRSHLGARLGGLDLRRHLRRSESALCRVGVARGRRRPPVGPGEAGAYDMGHLLAEGIARAPELTRAGLRAGLERVKALPRPPGAPGR